MKGVVKVLIHLGLTVLVFVVLIALTMYGLRKYTRHDTESVAVPEIEGMRIDKAVEFLEKEGFEYEISDTVYKDGVPLMSVIDQDPDPDFRVKPGRRIYLVVNSDKIPMVSMPDLAGKESYRSALVLLRARGLQMGEKIEKPSSLIKDPDSEPVLEQRVHGDSTEIAPGTPIRRNSKIDLVVGVMIKSFVPDSTNGEFFDGGDY